MNRTVRALLIGLFGLAGVLVASLGVLAIVRASARRALAALPAEERTFSLALLRAEDPTTFVWIALGLAAGLLIPLGAFAWRAWRTLRPVRDVALSARLAAEGRLVGPVPAPDDDVAGEIADAINRMRRGFDARVDEIEEEHRLVISLLRGMHEGLVWIGPGRRILLANDAFREIFALAHDPEGQLLAEVVRIPALMREIDAALSEGREVPDAAVELPGSGRAFQVRVAPVEGREGGRPAGALVLFFDVTRLEALERVRRDFVANVSHELRTPLTSIKAFVETLIDDRLEDPARALDFLAIVRKHVDRMAALIDDLTDLSLIETGAVALHLEDLDAREIASDVLAQFEYKARQAGVSMRLAIEGPVPIRADRRRIEQILVNLVDNAIKFNRSGGEVRIGAAVDEGRASVIVEDTGTGIPAESLDRVFNRFYRVDTARSREAGGTGLGLAIVRNLMRLHGGQVRLESDLGRGSRFILDFPAPRS